MEWLIWVWIAVAMTSPPYNHSEKYVLVQHEPMSYIECVKEAEIHSFTVEERRKKRDDSITRTSASSFDFANGRDGIRGTVRMQCFPVSINPNQGR